MCACATPSSLMSEHWGDGSAAGLDIYCNHDQVLNRPPVCARSCFKDVKLLNSAQESVAVVTNKRYSK
jgi:hypothetical protein